MWLSQPRQWIRQTLTELKPQQVERWSKMVMVRGSGAYKIRHPVRTVTARVARDDLRWEKGMGVEAREVLIRCGDLLLQRLKRCLGTC